MAPDLVRDRERFREFRASAKGEDAPARIAYLDGRLLQRAGKYPEARARFEEVSKRDPLAAEPHLRLSECLRAEGDFGKAEATCREAIEKGVSGEEIWDLWFSMSVLDLKRSAAEVLASFPRIADLKAQARGGDLRWALERLRDEGALRLNCGGEEGVSSGGVKWGADRFFSRTGYRYFGDKQGAAKEPFLGEIGGTEDDWLYQTERWFAPDPGGPAGYRIPLPQGAYRVTLHFAEILKDLADRRSFDVLVEGEEKLSGYCPGKAGFATAETKAFEVSVKDGFLEIEFVRRVADPKISGIEVAKAQGPAPAETQGATQGAQGTTQRTESSAPEARKEPGER